MAIIDRLKDTFCARPGMSALGGLCFALSLFGCGSIVYPDVNKDPMQANEEFCPWELFKPKLDNLKDRILLYSSDDLNSLINVG